MIVMYLAMLAVPIAFVLLFVVALGFFLGNRRAIRERESANSVPPALLHAAQLTGGRIHGSASPVPNLRFSCDGIETSVRCFPAPPGGRPRLRLHFAWRPPAPFWLEPESPAWRRAPTRARMKDIQVGDPEFDRLFLIHGPSEEWVRTALDPATRQAILDLARHRPGSRTLQTPLHLQAGRSGVALQLAYDPFAVGKRSFVAFLERATGLLKLLRARAGAGLEVLAQADSLTDGTCPVCGEAAAEPMCCCADCRTPHHTDCWEYFGGCAIYACGGDRATAAGPGSDPGPTPRSKGSCAAE